MKKKFIASMMALTVLASTTVLFKSNEVNASANYGTKRTLSGGYSYAYGWTGQSGQSCKVFTSMFDVKDEVTANGWAQTKQLMIAGLPNQMAKSNHWVNNEYVGYSQN